MERHEVKMCSSCGAPIIWARQSAPGRHRPNPINALPADDGTIRLNTDGYYTIVKSADIGAYWSAGVPLHTSHFATCPHASAHRRRKAPA